DFIGKGFYSPEFVEPCVASSKARPKGFDYGDRICFGGLQVRSTLFKVDAMAHVDVTMLPAAGPSLKPAIVDSAPSPDVSGHPFVKALKNPPKAGAKLRALMRTTVEL